MFTMDVTTDLARSISGAIRALHERRTLDETLQTIAAQERATLADALEGRRVIGEAVGILMERYEMNEDRAFAFLVRASSHTDTELRAVAQELVDERTS